MSLKFFHIVFITLSTLLALGIAALEYGNYRAVGTAGYLIGVVVCGVIAVGLVAYGIWFLRKTRRLIL